MKRHFSIGGLAALAGCALVLAALLVGAASAAGQSQLGVHQPGAGSAWTDITYQGYLRQGGAPVNGSCNMIFRLYDDPNAGNLLSTITAASVPISNGVFTADRLSLGYNFTGNAVWLEISVRCPASTGLGSFTTLTPRQPLTAVPYALFSYTPWVTNGRNVSYYNGNVGIGTVNPSALLSVADSGAAEPNVQGYPTGLKVGTFAGTVPLALRQNSLENGTPALAYFETSSGDLGSLGAAPSTFVVGAAASHGLGFNVNGSTRAMTIFASGNVGIGTTNPHDRLEVGGELRVANCVRNSGGTPIAGACPSDARLKTNVTAFPQVLDKVTQLQPVYFNWRAAEYPDYHFDGSTRSYGVIAQDVEQVLPELVGSDGHGFKTVNYGEMPLLLLQALKDLRAEKDAQIAMQQKQIDELQARLVNSDQTAQPTAFNLFNLLSVIAIGGVTIMAWQQRRSRQGDGR